MLAENVTKLGEYMECISAQWEQRRAKVGFLVHLNGRFKTLVKACRVTDIACITSACLEVVNEYLCVKLCEVPVLLLCRLLSNSFENTTKPIL